MRYLRTITYSTIGVFLGGLMMWLAWGGDSYAPIHTAQSPSQSSPQAVFVCPMHPDFTQDKKGLCPICQMDLVLKKFQGPAVILTKEQRESLLLRLAPVKKQNLEKWIRTAGILEKDDRTLWVDVVGSQSGDIKLGQEARVKLLTHPLRLLQGEVSKILPYPAQNTSRVKISLKYKTFWPEERYYVVLIVRKLGKYLAVPQEAVFWESDQPKVYVFDHDRFKSMPVTLGRKGEIYDEVVSGLKHGEKVATYGNFFVDSAWKLQNL